MGHGRVLTVLLAVWPVIATLDGSRTAALATREDETRGTAAILEVGAATVSIVGVLFALQQASETGGSEKVILTTAAMLTILVSWVLVTTVYVLRYAHLHYTSQAGGVDFHADTPPNYLDFAYMAFTIGMTYQVSDTEVRVRPSAVPCCARHCCRTCSERSSSPPPLTSLRDSCTSVPPAPILPAPRRRASKACDKDMRKGGLEPLAEHGKSRGYGPLVPGGPPSTPPVVPGGNSARGAGKKHS
jgi:hypothetical protein